jgi:predicted transcriptional regulator
MNSQQYFQEDLVNLSYIQRFLLNYAFEKGEIEPYSIINDNDFDINVVMDIIENFFDKRIFTIKENKKIILTEKGSQIALYVHKHFNRFNKNWLKIPEKFRGMIISKNEIYIPKNFVNDRKKIVQG